MSAFLARVLLILAAVSVCAAPSAAQPIAPMSAYEVDQAGYGRWIAQLSEIERPVHDALGSMQGYAQTLLESRDLSRTATDYRAEIRRHIATVDAVDARLAALETPEFPALQLPAEFSTAAVKRKVLEMNRHVRASLSSFIPLFDAIARRDLAAAQAANARSMEAVRLMMESQLLLVRASQAPLRRTQGAWHIVNIQVIYYRLVVRLIQDWPQAGRTLRQTAPLAREMNGLAAELDATASEGEARLEAELRLVRSMHAQAERRGDAARATVFRRSLAVMSEGRTCFPLAREFAALLRREAAALARGTLTPEAFVAMFQRFYAIRNRLGEIDRNIAEVLRRG